MTVHPQSTSSLKRRLRGQMPGTSLGKWTVAAFGVHVGTVAAVVAVLSTVGSGFESEAFLDPPALGVALVVAAIAALAATVLGMISIFARRDRSTLVIVVTVLAAAPTLFFIGELLSVVGVFPSH